MTDRCLFISASHAARAKNCPFQDRGFRVATQCNRGNDTRARAHDHPAFDNPRRVCAQRPRRVVKTIYAYIFRFRAWLGIKRANYEKARRGSVQHAETPRRAERVVEDILRATASRDEPIPSREVARFAR